MKTIRFDDIDLSIDLKRCVTVFDIRSAAGKTYLEFATKSIANRPAMNTFSNKTDYANFKKLGWMFGDECIYIFDRYEFFRDSVTDDMIQESNDICVLLDIKDLSIANNFKCEVSSAIIERDTQRRFVVRNGNLLRR